MYINGLGLCSSNGSLIKELTDAIGAVNFPLNTLHETDFKKQLRSTGAFVTAALRAATEALHESGITPENLSTMGIIVTSRIGDQNTTSEFIDELIDYGIDQGSPLKFAHSVHNAAASYIAKQFSIYGPAITAVNFEASFLNGLTLAQCWLEEGTCNNVLLLQIESSSLLSQALINYANTRKILPLLSTQKDLLANSKAQCLAACFLLGKTALHKDKISISRSKENTEQTVEKAIIDTAMPDPIRLMSAILKVEKREFVTITSTTYMIEKS